MNNNKHYIKNGQNIMINTAKNNNIKYSNIEMNANNDKDTITVSKDEGGTQQYSKNIINSSIKKDTKYNMITGKDKTIPIKSKTINVNNEKKKIKNKYNE